MQMQNHYNILQPLVNSTHKSDSPIVYLFFALFRIDKTNLYFRRNVEILISDLIGLVGGHSNVKLFVYSDQKPIKCNTISATKKYFKHKIPLMFATDFMHSPSSHSIRLNCSASVNFLSTNGSSQNSSKLLHDQHFNAKTRQKFIQNITHWWYNYQSDIIILQILRMYLVEKWPV